MKSSESSHSLIGTMVNFQKLCFLRHFGVKKVTKSRMAGFNIPLGKDASTNIPSPLYILSLIYLNGPI